MKYNEEEFKQELFKLYGTELILIGRYKNIISPILVQDRYGILKITQARQVLNNKPGIKAALNKTEYFMNQLKEKYPDIYDMLEPQSEYIAAKQKMLFKTKFGIVSASPDALIHGHMPNIRSAIDRKEYFKNQLLFIYNNEYDFEVTSTDRHSGRVTLICPIHGKQSIDSDTIFTGCGCPKCNSNFSDSNLFYIVRLFNKTESFYKLGISHKLKNGKISRFNTYKLLGYQVEVLKTIIFNDAESCKQFELEQKQLIKHNLYIPQVWPYKTSTESFTDSDLVNSILNNIENIKYDIVSTSDESQSCESGQEVANPTEDN